ncbi:MAG: inositol-3-phosphate synthase, partial [Syntrophobacteraceae bacterium]
MAGTGVLIVGAMGHIAATVVVGASALKLSETPRIGMVTDLGDFAGLGLPEPGEMVFGGWDIRSRNLGDAARDILRKSALPDEGDAVSRIGNALERYSANIFLGTAANCGEAIRSLADGEREKACDSLEDLAGQMREDIRKFKNDNNLGSVVVVNLASTEPPLRLQVCHEDPDAFEVCLRRNDT